MIGAPCARGLGEPAAPSTILKPINPSTPGKSASKATPATAKPPSSPWAYDPRFAIAYVSFFR